MGIIEQGLYNPQFEKDNCGAGFICSLNGERTNTIIHKALEVLARMDHRGAISADGKTGDGAGILIEIPHDFFKENCDFKLPKFGRYAVGMLFLPPSANQRKLIRRIFKKELENKGLKILGWRKVPTAPEHLGKIAEETLPFMQQVFVAPKDKNTEEKEFQLKLFAARKKAEHRIIASKFSETQFFYVCSLSIRTIIYKGLLRPDDIKLFYTDLQEPKVITRLALVHQRFSTNTFPTWDLAQPFRYMCHNGEINTLKGNIGRMHAREGLLKSDYFGKEIKELFPIVLPGKSDSASMDMVVELLLSTGRSLPEVMMILIPEAWEKHQQIGPQKKAFYEYYSCIMEPWDGPASIPFTDGKYIGALLDRNGLRPSRYTVTNDGYVIMSSETGVVDIEPENVALHGRLEPGKMFLVDMDAGRIIEDSEIKDRIVGQHPYQKWLDNNLLRLSDIPYTGNKKEEEALDYETRQNIFGYTAEDIKSLIIPAATTGKETIGSMGTDTPLAVLSNKPQLLYNYFKQLFAQVTNPPLDGIREAIVTDISLSIGKEYNLFDIQPKHAKKLNIQNPVISSSDLDKIKHLNHTDFQAKVVSVLYQVDKGLNGLEKQLTTITQEVERAIEKGINIIILSDRGVSKSHAPIPMLLACSHVQQTFTKRRMRSKFSMIIESAEPREPHHFALLFGYGASAINPYMVNEIIYNQVAQKDIEGIPKEKAIGNFNTAIGYGIIKIMNKIGISTLHSYRGSKIFEAVGLHSNFVNKYFEDTPSRIQGIGLYEIEKEISQRHQKAFHKQAAQLPLEIGGEYRWRQNGEKHLFNPFTVSKLQHAVRNNTKKTYKEYADAINKQNKDLMTIRGLLDFASFNPIPIEEVEPWTEIVKRFKTGAMSFGSISSEAHENLAIAMNRIGGKSNSGEGGEHPDRYHRKVDGTWKNSAIKQVASGRFGVSSNYLTNAAEIQIKMAQGAKPGEGGQLPGPKVYPWVAEVRHSTPYVGLISPPPHHDIYSIEDLAQLIYDLKNANREARINVKLVSKAGIGTIAAGVAKAKADVILISGFDGGTGASPLTSIKHAGLPWELGLAETQQTLVLNDLRNRVAVECDGQLKTGRDVAIACLLGAEEFGFATAPLVASGCIMMRACHLNTCPVGIATQDPELRKNFKGKPEHVINFMYFVAEELRQIMAQLGYRTINEMVGQSQKLETKDAISHYKAKGIDLSKILYKPKVAESTKLYQTTKQDHGLEEVLDTKILQQALPAIYRGEGLYLDFNIKNTDRSTGAIISNEISKMHGAKGLPEDTIKLNFFGTAGQSFGAFATKGLSLKVYGNTNDYLGKGLSGAKLIIQVPPEASFQSNKNIITGNVTLYGAISGEAYINGIAGERFCVRNSGAKAVVEGVGDHGCEYMTGGIAIILGAIGRNFAAGMSGGVAYVYNPDNNIDFKNFNTEMIEFEDIQKEDLNTLHHLIDNHRKYTNSSLAKDILKDWTNQSKAFIKVMPTDYKKALERIANENKSQLITQ
ncbi:MAG: glutamate synthase large subunit [Flavobacteriaceae bacterium]|nr:glutamate synthase large subunit [Flavobacteriaceae bacterium]